MFSVFCPCSGKLEVPSLDSRHLFHPLTRLATYTDLCEMFRFCFQSREFKPIFIILMNENNNKKKNMD